MGQAAAQGVEGDCLGVALPEWPIACKLSQRLTRGKAMHIGYMFSDYEDYGPTSIKISRQMLT